MQKSFFMLFPTNINSYMHEANNENIFVRIAVVVSTCTKIPKFNPIKYATQIPGLLLTNLLSGMEMINIFHELYFRSWN